MNDRDHYAIAECFRARVGFFADGLKLRDRLLDLSQRRTVRLWHAIGPHIEGRRAYGHRNAF